MTTDTKAVARWDIESQDGRDCLHLSREDGEYVLFTDQEQVVADLRAELAAKSKEVDRLDESETRAIKQRDHAYEIIDELCDTVLGSGRSEWSSVYYFEDAAEEVEDEVAALREDAKRYRWLKKNCQNVADEYATAGQLFFGTYLYGNIDSAIDADIEKGEGNV